MQEQDLATIGAAIEIPAATTFGSRRAHREGRAAPGSGDRLAELADWWAGVAGTAPPRQVQQLWLSRPGVAPTANTEVVLRRFDAPKTVPEAIAWGVTVADDAVDDGTDLVLLSLAPEDRDEISWQVLAVHLLDLDAITATGWPAADRSSDRDWVERVAGIRDGLRRVRGIRNAPERLLTELDSPALATGTGLLLQAAARRTPVLLDGPGAAACALLAHRVARASRNWYQAADAGRWGLHDRILTELRLTPLTRLGLPDEDGTAGRFALTLLETAVGRAIESTDEDLAAGDDAGAVTTDDQPLDEELGLLDQRLNAEAASPAGNRADPDDPDELADPADPSDE